MELNDMLVDIMRRSAKAGHEVAGNDRSYTYTMTDADRKKLIKLVHRFPIQVNGREISFDLTGGAHLISRLPHSNGDTDESPKPALTLAIDMKEAEIWPATALTSHLISVDDPMTPADPSQNTKASLKDILMWVGYQGYPTIESFVQEAKAMGVCKRIGKIPGDIVLGETRVLLAHDEGCFSFDDADHKVNDAVIFGYFYIDRIEAVARREDQLDPDLLSRCVLVPYETIIDESERGCGYRVDGGLYLRSAILSHEMVGGILKETSGLGVYGDLIVLDEPIDYNKEINVRGDRFRSILRIDGDAILKSVHRKPCPRSRAARTLSEGFNPDTKAEQDWVEEERVELMRLSASMGPHRACKEFARQTCRTFQASMYQYRKMAQVMREESAESSEEDHE